MMAAQYQQNNGYVSYNPSRDPALWASVFSVSERREKGKCLTFNMPAGQTTSDIAFWCRSRLPVTF